MSIDITKELNKVKTLKPNKLTEGKEGEDSGKIYQARVTVILPDHEFKEKFIRKCRSEGITMSDYLLAACRSFVDS